MLFVLLACTTTSSSDSVEMNAASSEVSWKVVADAIRWNAVQRNLSVEAHLTGPMAERTEPVHVGVTAITASGQEVDLLVQTLFQGSFEQSVLFSVELDEEPVQVLIGAWSEKIEPCSVERPGCEEFGFVLDKSLASFPAGLYTAGERQRLLPASYAVQFVGTSEAHREAVLKFAGVYGASVQLTPAESSSLSPGVWVGQADDLGFARAVAHTSAPPLAFGVREGLNEPMVVVLPQ